MISMIRSSVAIAGMHIQTVLSNRTIFLFSLAMPLIFTFILGAVGSGVAERSAAWQIQVVNEDHGELGQLFVGHLRKLPTLVITTTEQTIPLEETDTFILLIPGDFSRLLLQGQTPVLDLEIPENAVQDTWQIEAAIRAQTSTFAGAVRATQIAHELSKPQLASTTMVSDLQWRNLDQQATLTQLVAEWEALRPIQITVVTGTAGDSKPKETAENSAESTLVPGKFTQSSAGMVVMFALFLMLGGGIVLTEEREQGTLRRLLMMPMPKASILIGKLLGIFILGTVQILLLIGAGVLIFGVNWGQSPLALLLMVLSFSLAATSLGILIAALVRTNAQAEAAGSILVYITSALGGAWWPIDVTPDWMQQLGKAVPTYWAMQGFHSLISSEVGLLGILPYSLMLWAFALLFLFVGLWRFQCQLPHR